MFDYDNWIQEDEESLPWLKHETTRQVNYSYSRLLPIIGTYYAKFFIYSITKSTIVYRDQIAEMKEVISKEAFFKITEGIINSAEKILATKNTEKVSETVQSNKQTL